MRGGRKRTDSLFLPYMRARERTIWEDLSASVRPEGIALAAGLLPMKKEL
jgi:hypothetical protein